MDDNTEYYFVGDDDEEYVQEIRAREEAKNKPFSMERVEELKNIVEPVLQRFKNKAKNNIDGRAESIYKALGILAKSVDENSLIFSKIDCKIFLEFFIKKLNSRLETVIKEIEKE